MNEQVVDGQTIVSAGGIFELGFFSPNGSQGRYVGIWYKGLPTEKVAWVANRERPLIGSNGVLMIESDGNLVLVDHDKNSMPVVWSTQLSLTSNNTIIKAVLTDEGNLVLRENKLNESVVLWESFNHPSDALLPRMKIGLNTRTGEQIIVTSWKDDTNPSLGSFTIALLDPQELVQVIVLNGSLKHFRSGQWNRGSFIGVPSMTKDYSNGFQLLTDNKGETVYFSYGILNYSSPILIYLDSSGAIIQMDWDAENNKWLKMQVVPKGQCDLYNTCGPFGSCKNNDSPICKCFKGYEPKSMSEWNKGNWISGCVRRAKFQCEETSPNSDDDERKRDVFLPVSGMKLPDFSHYLLTWDKMECQDSCLKNCSCLAYAYVDGIGCMIWGKDLIDLQEFSHGGEKLYIRLAHSQLDKGRQMGARIAIIVSATVGLILIGCTLYILKIRKTGIGSLIPSCRGRIASKHTSAANLLHKSFTQGSSSELPVFSFKCIETATKNFCPRNKLGEGGFGPVYKGVLPNGQEVAIKRLSRSSGQGIEEFKNEVTLISRLQHRNLVKLMGFCIHGEEKLLIYEYMSNRSLDVFIFGSRSDDKAALSWNQRYSIIEGIARGLLYLHRDSRLKVIHRDLKASNILLDEDMNPKISDFGMARIFGGKQTIANTNRIAGTYGYMSPEYAIQGMFSEKSDVFSFGVILLEIISSKRNNSFSHSKDSLNLLEHAWQLWNEGKILDLPDPRVAGSLETTQVVRCIVVGLLCVQEHANDRPNTATIVSTLCNDTILPSPKRPAYSKDGSADDSNFSPCSRNSFSISNVEGR
ncbi:g-type lectin s-receptor-like serinethreonine-protein kinase [Nicotiana attenuata]|uniref:Receptor-like serine/threonine-protein kinase n=2 Tax=Nicotiana attenuata TaxID=49451 RepID=A0A314KLH0_NICAT|nr:g-type lectin s-receptor-like serinethreonine-protein kinase [Nicotiana attenuata]